MFYFLSKAIDFLIMPLSIVMLLMAYGLLTKNARRKRIAVVLALVFLLLMSNAFFVIKAFNWWEPTLVHIDKVDQTYDVGILLSGGLIASREPNAPQSFLGTHGDRILQIFNLYKAGKIRHILITGTSEKYLLKIGKGETSRAAALLTHWGVPARDILFEEKARNTRENAIFSAKILKEKYPNGRFILVTSAFHMRRSAGCFDKAGIKTDIFPADFYGGYNVLTFRNGLRPDPNALADFNLLWHELVGFVIYKLIGYC
jgi:uncharacterized SAM-binding protein YcdF (DUF218 family)